MQCTRCGQTLAAGVRFCQACGEPVVGSTPTMVETDGLAGEPGTAELAANQETPAYTGFAFQEFRAAPAPGQAFTSPTMPLPGQPLPTMPGMPWSGTPGAPLPGQPGAGMYAPYPPGVPGYPFYPAQAAPKKQKKLWTSVGCIVSYVVLAVLLVFTGLGVGLAVLGSHLASNTASQKTVAMQLYKQVTSNAPDLTDPMTANSDAANWDLYNSSTDGCAIQSDGLHMRISDNEHFSYCLDNETNAGDIAFQVQMHLISGEGGGLVFRAGYTQGRYAFQLDQDGSCQVFVSEEGASSPTTLATGSVSSLQEGTDAPGTLLTLIEKGSHYYFYVNGQYVLSTSDTTFTSGAVGVLASDYNSPAEAVYTDAKVWNL